MLTRTLCWSRTNNRLVYHDQGTTIIAFECNFFKNRDGIVCSDLPTGEKTKDFHCTKLKKESGSRAGHASVAMQTRSNTCKESV